MVTAAHEQPIVRAVKVRFPNPIIAIGFHQRPWEVVGSNCSNKFTEIIESVGVGLRQIETPHRRTVQPNPHTGCDHRGSYVRGLWKSMQSTDHDRMSARAGNRKYPQSRRLVLGWVIRVYHHTSTRA